MKKILLLMFVIMAALSAKAQDMYLGGGISLWIDDDADKTSFSISPEFGYNLNSQWAVGGSLFFSHEENDPGNNVNSFALAPYARYSFYENKVIRLFLDMGFGFSTTKVKHEDSYNGFEIGVKPGVAIKLNEKFSLITKVGFAGYRDDYYHGKNGLGVGLDGSDISFGLYYSF